MLKKVRASTEASIYCWLKNPYSSNNSWNNEALLTNRNEPDVTQRRKKLFVIEKSLVKILGDNGFLKIILAIQRKIC